MHDDLSKNLPRYKYYIEQRQTLRSNLHKDTNELKNALINLNNESTLEMDRKFVRDVDRAWKTVEDLLGYDYVLHKREFQDKYYDIPEEEEDVAENDNSN